MLTFHTQNPRENCIPLLIAEYGVVNLRFLRISMDINLYLQFQSKIMNDNYLGGIRHHMGDSMCYQLLSIKSFTEDMENLIAYESFSSDQYPDTHSLDPVKFNYQILDGTIRVFVETPDGLTEIDVNYEG